MDVKEESSYYSTVVVTCFVAKTQRRCVPFTISKCLLQDTEILCMFLVNTGAKCWMISY